MTQDPEMSDSEVPPATGDFSCMECGVTLAEGTQFCGSCGATVRRSTIEPPQPEREKLAVPDVARGVPIPKKTMMGLSGEMPPVIPPESPLPPKVDDTSRVTNAGLSQPAPGQMGRTMLGIPMASSPPLAQRGTLPPGAKPAPKQQARTMFGMPLVAPGGPRGSRVPAEPEPDSAQGEGSAPRNRDMPGHKATMIAAGIQVPAPTESSAKGKGNAATAFGLPNPVALAQDATERSTERLQRDELALPSAHDGDPKYTPLPPRFDDETGKIERSGGYGKPTSRPPAPRSAAPMVLAIVGVLGVAALGAYMFLGKARGPAVEVRIDSKSGTEKMVFEVAGAKPGAKLRFGGIEQAIEGGLATFPLGAGSLQVGQNAVLFDVLEPDGESHPGRVVLSLDYRVTVDTAPLHTGKGAVDVVVSALPGSRAWIGGEELKLDAQGHGSRREELEASALSQGKTIEHVASYRVQPPSQEPHVGEIKTIIPITSLTIDRPGLQIVTDQEAVEIAGTVDEDATVTLDGEPLAVQGGRFLQRYPLPAVGKHAPVLIARAAGKAPRSITLAIERVSDLAEAARSFAADPSLTYTKIATNPAIYAGQKAAFEGRIYNVSVDNGKSVLQMLARDCTAGRRCPLWVEYGSATDLTVDRWVRAVGTITGAQQFRAENDAVQTVPKLDAFVLVPIEP